MPQNTTEKQPEDTKQYLKRSDEQCHLEATFEKKVDKIDKDNVDQLDNLDRVTRWNYLQHYGTMAL